MSTVIEVAHRFGSTRMADLFAGGGGVTQGARQVEGVEVVAALNHWPEAVALHAARHPNVAHYCQDANQFDFRKLSRIDMLWASPSCLGNSEAAQPARARDADVAARHDDLRSSAWAVVTATLATRPRVVIIENVPAFRDWRPPGTPVEAGLRSREHAQDRARKLRELHPGVEFKVAHTREGWSVLRMAPKGSLYQHWLEVFRLAGYEVTETIMVASRFGVPQRRRRLIIVASRVGRVELRNPDVAEPPIGPVLDFEAGAWKPIAAVRYPGARRRAEFANELFRGSPCWGQHASHRGAWARALTEPARTITGQNQLYLVRDGQYRLWDLREVAQGQDFPPDYFDAVEFKTDAHVMAGNAVPPGLATGVIEQALEVAA